MSSNMSAEQWRNELYLNLDDLIWNARLLENEEDIDSITQIAGVIRSLGIAVEFHAAKLSEAIEALSSRNGLEGQNVPMPSEGSK